MGKKFRDLAVLEISEEEWTRPIPVGPAEELKHGHLENGMRCASQDALTIHAHCAFCMLNN